MFYLNHRKGFTLIEVMVSASILALLAAIIFANVNQGRVKAAEVKALQEAKQFQTALELYRDNLYSSQYPTASGSLANPVLEDILVPNYIPSLSDDSPYNGNCSNNLDKIQYYSTNNVATDGIKNFKCGPLGEVDQYVIFYPTIGLVSQENSLYFKPLLNPHTWFVGFVQNCNMLGLYSSLYSNNDTAEDYDVISRWGLRIINNGAFQYRCVAI